MSFDLIDRLLEALAGLNPLVLYLLTGLFTMLETSALVGLVVPGDAVVLLAGTTATSPARFLALVATAVAGSLAGESVGYLLGRRFGDRLRTSRLGRLGRRGLLAPVWRAARFGPLPDPRRPSRGRAAGPDGPPPPQPGAQRPRCPLYGASWWSRSPRGAAGRLGENPGSIHKKRCQAVSKVAVHPTGRRRRSRRATRTMALPSAPARTIVPKSLRRSRRGLGCRQ